MNISGVLVDNAGIGDNPASFRIGEMILYSAIETKLVKIPAELLQGGSIGIEKEGLRVGVDGCIAQSPHPPTLGSALTNPYITTDYSEALLELITPPFKAVNEVLDFLTHAHQFVYQQLGDEFIWATSMPCVLSGDRGIPIAEYGKSNAGLMKTVYRRGLGHRYGKMMQVIAGVHFNYSVNPRFWPEYQSLLQDTHTLRHFTDESYMGLTRNLQRFGWVISYLFGCSPAICKSFLKGQPTKLQEFNEHTYYEPYATSLRMGDIGYQNNRECEIGMQANYNNLSSYIESLTKAIETSYPAYENIGLIQHGEYQQLNTNILQIENEYYSTVRPKQVVEANEKPTHALSRRGIRYIELRSLDVNLFDPLGVNEMQLRFIEVFVLFCLLVDSPVVTRDERKWIDENQNTVAHRGREPGLHLIRNGEPIALSHWAREICQAMHSIAETLDSHHNDTPYVSALLQYRSMIDHPENTPSARLLAELEQHQQGFFQLAKQYSLEYKNNFLRTPLPAAMHEFFSSAAQKSIRQQQQIEEADTLSFAHYLQRYFSQTL